MTKPVSTPPAAASTGRRSHLPSSSRLPSAKNRASGTSTTDTWYIHA